MKHNTRWMAVKLTAIVAMTMSCNAAGLGDFLSSQADDALRTAVGSASGRLAEVANSFQARGGNTLNKVDITAESIANGTVTVQNGSKASLASVTAENSQIKGTLLINAKSQIGSLSVQNGSVFKAASTEIKDSTVTGNVTLALESKVTGSAEVSNGSCAKLASFEMIHSTAKDVRVKAVSVINGSLKVNNLSVFKAASVEL